MQVSSTFALWSLIFALPLCVYIFWMDMKHKKISNKSVWALFAVFVAVGLLTLSFEDFAWRFANYVVVFGVLFLMWMVRQVGAGDVKMAAVAALFVDRADAGVYHISGPGAGTGFAAALDSGFGSLPHSAHAT